MSKEFTKLNNHHQYRIHYLGARPHNTIALHKKYAFQDKNQIELGAAAYGESINRYPVDTRRIVDSHMMQ